MTNQPARVRIVSDGTRSGTTVTVNDVPLDGVTAITWDADVSFPRAKVHLTLYGVDVELEGDLTETVGRTV
jgi:autotransporter translocation and assembly factor TamB